MRLAPMISVARVTKVSDGVTLLDNVTFDVEKGTCIGVVDTERDAHRELLHMLATLTLPSSGTISIGGTDAIKHPLSARRRIAYADLGLAAGTGLRVAEYLWLVARTRGAASEHSAYEMANRVDLDLQSPVDRLAPDRRRMLALVAALSAQTDVILLDTPPCGPTTATADACVQLIHETIEKGATIVAGADDALDLAAICDDVFTFRAGRLTRAAEQSA